MRNITRTVTAVIVLGLFTAVACKKSTTSPAPSSQSNNSSTGCNGKPICFKMDGNDVMYDSASWMKLSANSGSPARYRVYVEAGQINTSSYRNIEIDVYADKVGKYTVVHDSKDNYSANDGTFGYFIADGNKVIYGKSGMIEITKIDNTNNTISGTFTITGFDEGANKTYNITNGNFVDVPLK